MCINNMHIATCAAYNLFFLRINLHCVHKSVLGMVRYKRAHARTYLHLFYSYYYKKDGKKDN